MTSAMTVRSLHFLTSSILKSVAGCLITSRSQVVVAAGTYNTQKLLHKMKRDGVLPKISNFLGKLSRTNSEALTGAMMPKHFKSDFSQGSAITSSFFPNEHTHVEPVRYGKGSNLMGLLQTVMTDGNTAKSRRKAWLREVIKQPPTKCAVNGAPIKSPRWPPATPPFFSAILRTTSFASGI